MKLLPKKFTNKTRQRQGGVAVIVMLVLLSLLLIYIVANLKTLYILDRELKLTNQRQINRLNSISAFHAPTNAAAALIVETNQPGSFP